MTGDISELLHTLRAAWARQSTGLSSNDSKVWKKKREREREREEGWREK